MKIPATFILSFIFTIGYSQVDDFNTLVDNGKAEFKKENYANAIEYFESAVKIAPENAEARYFLGYSYSRANSQDGQSMIGMNLLTTIKASEQFEIVNKLTAKYTGEIVLLDPYTKISAEWGSMAMSYWHNNKPDSAIWAFKEGKRRGGFGEYILSINRKVLDTCSQNAILISSGDIYTIPLWYLQIVEGYRKEVSVVDISLLNASWYPTYLSKNNIVSFDLPNEILDTINYCIWSDSTISINNFSWTVKPSYYDHYILRGDRIFLSLLKMNNFQRDVYFTKGFMEESRLSLQKYIKSLIVSDKLEINSNESNTMSDYKRSIEEILALSKLVNKNSPDEFRILDNFRFDIFNKVYSYLTTNNMQEAKRLIDLLDKYTNEKEFPYKDESANKYLDNLRQELK
jgi:hypothetical protein